MKLNELEKKLIKEFLKQSGIIIDAERAFFSKITVKERYYTGVGFFTKFHQSDKLRISHEEKTFIWNEGIGAKLNNTVETGYLFYIKMGYLEEIEGFTYDDEWPEKIHSIDTYKIKYGT